MSLTPLKSISKDKFQTILASLNTIVTDCDCVLWLENDAFPGSPEVIQKFKEIGKKIFYVTNNSTKTREEYVEKCCNLGFPATTDEIIAPGFLAANYLEQQNFKKKVYIVGSEAIAKELDKVGIKNFGVGPDYIQDAHLNVEKIKPSLEPEVEAVIVGFDVHISITKIIKASTYLNNPNCFFIATNTDRRKMIPDRRYVFPGAGSMVSTIETSSQRKPLILGKPEAFIQQTLAEKYNVNPKTTLMIGDKCSTDIVLGKRCGYTTLLVLTGHDTLENVKQWKESTNPVLQSYVPDYYIDKLGDMLPLFD